MDIWSVSQIFKRLEVQDFKKLAGFRRKKAAQMPAIDEEKQNYDKLTKLKGGDGTEAEYAALKIVGDDKETDEKKEIEEDGTLIVTKETTADDDEKEQDGKDKKDGQHQTADTVDDILENYNLNEISETSDEPEVDPNDQPVYSKCASESKSKATGDSVGRSVPKPNLETINSE